MKRILYSHGEPAGIGIDIVLYLSKLRFWEEIKATFVCIADKEILETRAQLLSLKINFVEIKSLEKAKKNKCNKKLNFKI